MKHLFLAIFLSISIGQSAFCQKDELLIKIALKNNLLTAKKSITVQAGVTNVSGKEQSIAYLTCSYDDLWEIDNQSLVKELFACPKNILQCKTLMAVAVTSSGTPSSRSQLSKDDPNGNIKFMR
jgi:hypothetical protein